MICGGVMELKRIYLYSYLLFLVKILPGTRWSSPVCFSFFLSFPLFLLNWTLGVCLSSPLLALFSPNWVNRAAPRPAAAELLRWHCSLLSPPPTCFHSFQP